MTAIFEKNIRERLSANANDFDAIVVELLAEIQKKNQDSILLDWVEKNAVDLRCVSVNCSDDDSSFQWVVIEHHMGEPREREIGRGYGEEKMREAIEAAMAYHAFG